MQGPVPAMIMGESDARDLQLAMQKAPGASHSRSRVALVDNLSPGTSLSGLLRLFEGFHMQEHAATLLPKVGKQLLTRVSLNSVSSWLDGSGILSPELCMWRLYFVTLSPAGIGRLELHRRLIGC